MVHAFIVHTVQVTNGYCSSNYRNTNVIKDSHTPSNWARGSYNHSRDEKPRPEEVITDLENLIDLGLIQIFRLLYTNVGKSGSIYVILIDRLYQEGNCKINGEFTCGPVVKTQNF